MSLQEGLPVEVIAQQSREGREGKEKGIKYGGMKSIVFFLFFFCGMSGHISDGDIRWDQGQEQDRACLPRDRVDRESCSWIVVAESYWLRK